MLAWVKDGSLAPEVLHLEATGLLKERGELVKLLKACQNNLKDAKPNLGGYEATIWEDRVAHLNGKIDALR